MAESGALVTQGNVDWGRLAQMPLTFSVDVLNRLAKANVDVISVRIGTALGAQFIFPPEGQRELIMSLDSLKGFSAASNTIWFGFGVKHIVRSMAETEQGAMCVALCAALCESRKPWDVGCILREMCLAQGAPLEVAPSVHQWQNLALTCQGTLKRSHFTHVYYHFQGLLCPRTPGSVEVTDQHIATAPPVSMANALLTLGKLSRKELLSATFYGSNECAVLATIAQCLLRLSVEIQDEQANILHKSPNAGFATAVFARASEQTSRDDSTATSHLIRRREYFEVKSDNFLPPKEQRYGGPTKWSSIFSDTFGAAWDEFSDPRLATALRDLLRHAGHAASSPFISCSLKDSGRVEMRDPFAPMQDRLRQRGLNSDGSPNTLRLEQEAARIFPELALLFTTCLSLDQDERLSPTDSCPSEPPISSIFRTLHTACRGRHCSKPHWKDRRNERLEATFTHERLATSGPDYPDSDRICLLQLSKVIVVITSILAFVEIDSTTPPRVSALRNMYTWACHTSVAHGGPGKNAQDHSQSILYGVSLPSDLKSRIRSHLDLLLYLFSGTRNPAKDDHHMRMWHQPSAVSKNGICIFYQLLKDHLLAGPDASTPVVLPGCISFLNRSFASLADEEFTPSRMQRLEIPSSDWLLPTTTRLVASETPDETRLNVFFQGSSASNAKMCFYPASTAIRTSRLQFLPTQQCSVLRDTYDVLLDGQPWDRQQRNCEDESRSQPLIVGGRLKEASGGEGTLQVLATNYRSPLCFYLQQSLDDVFIYRVSPRCKACILACCVLADRAASQGPYPVVPVIPNIDGVGFKIPPRPPFFLQSKLRNLGVLRGSVEVLSATGVLRAEFSLQKPENR